MNLKEFKPALWLIAKFFIAYIVLTLLYSQYLQHFSELKQIADPFTAWVAESTAQVMQWLGFNANSEQIAGETFRRFLLNGRYVCIINEGCNAIAIMIIFVSFIIAFSKRFLPSFLFSVGGVILLHLTNITRIAILNYIFAYHAEYSELAHDYLFPAIIYGMVVVLWIIWIVFFVLKNKN
ncbi:exosortase family protein XrtF [Ornithobacterium rhinotracheale]|uniref:exosortase family protein XrtF n=1 Tax=Ornithobacterium rhinotracheale TaxID=28251 RepID=UPI001FF4518C|nr:exosortase family protein XrtF [Ornithobacterium rhinotracheale]MCK0200465.1 exosortase family protein XrtF [Ornithobacterium rhinotracheale]UVD87811.1 exosortase family protein XrtF [Ornithobacterium rhinotracheale]